MYIYIYMNIFIVWVKADALTVLVFLFTASQADKNLDHNSTCKSSPQLGVPTSE